MACSAVYDRRIGHVTMLKFGRMSCYVRILQHRTFFETQPIVEPADRSFRQYSVFKKKDTGQVKVVLSFGTTRALLRFLN